jgi:hypothetical protein
MICVSGRYEILESLRVRKQDRSILMGSQWYPHP